TTMSELRNALRAFAVEGHSPSAALHRLNHFVRVTFGPRMLATVLFLTIDAAEEIVTMAVAGHPPPALRDADGRVRYLETDPTPPLGVDEYLSTTDVQFPISAGETLLLFTDGLVERRGESITEGFEHLRDVLARVPMNVDELCEHVVARMVDERASHDD